MGLTERRRAERLALIDYLVDDRDWVRLSKAVACAPGFDRHPGSPGSLVFDIDGVLLDTHRSFREVIPQTVSFYLDVILTENSGIPPMRAEDVHAYKSVGGFNNDWDVAEAGLILALWWSRQPESACSLPVLAERIAERGGGLEAVRTTLREGVGESVAAGILRDVDRHTLVRIFKEMYVGGSRFREVFGEEPRFYRGVGGMERERPLAEGPLWEAAREHPVGILTGRIPPETRLALERLGIDGAIEPSHVVTDDGRFPTKPDPTGLVYLAGRLTERPLYYFGDNRDDLSTLLGARDRLQATDLHFVYCLSGSTDSESVSWFAEQGASLVAVEVLDALAVLNPINDPSQPGR
jgi:phosphoglycolate phosphatase-like HAD superfamily hydrolase